MIDRVLTSPTLPSLPAVAVRVLELTADEDVRLEHLAETVQQDQALAAKILRTVNSSYYGLRESCTTISRALVLLGMRPVKSLVLGFSLLDAVGDGGGVDLTAFWRRSLYSAVAAKRLCADAPGADPEEVFLSGLLQDLGVIAMAQALGADYRRVLDAAGPDHAALCRAELEHLDVQHPEVGALLAESWRLPPSLTLAIRFHERPTAAPQAQATPIGLVALGNAVHDVLTDEDPTPALRRLYARGRQWFSLAPAALDAAVRDAAASTRELSRLFRVNTGATADAAAILERAEDQLIEMSRHQPRGTYAADVLAKADPDAFERDPLTGAASPSGFDAAVRSAFAPAHRGETPLSIVHVAVDALPEADRAHGAVARDELAIAVVALLHKHFEPMGGVVCRLSPAVFSVVLPGTSGAAASAAGAAFVKALPGAAGRTVSALADGPRVTAALGVATLDPDSAPLLTTPADLVTAAARAVQSARSAGGHCLRAYAPPRAAA